MNLLVKSTRRTKGARLASAILCVGLYPYVCAECRQPPEWNGKPLVLQVHHINGDPTDSRPENLQFLCPNCHTQTDTFAGRNCDRTMGNGVTGNTPGSEPGDGHARPGSSPGSPAIPVAA
jgi:5-methylcytosine-specific restriction endonuclease McrA